MTKQDSVFNRQINPLLQAGVILGVNIFIMLVVNLLGFDNEGDFGAMFPWTISATFLLFFVIFNSALSFSYENQNVYWGLSILAYILMIVIGGYVSYLISGLSMAEAKSIKSIYIIFTIGYVVLLVIVRSMRNILQIVLKQDKRLRGEE